ncbi:uncharacterized protein LOC110006521 [Amborella trichopoda]|uniref:uncharacterized protein LOC110006521 n=1 Tax=Amborella trichopoda TaxID=13333 RepID=UPI0009BE6D01|nr:uncharacterized protein LOC110006521 [Amborella trichopoda]|eukprot:XP_020517888.1 uncharacterized protein LOC110006521 [Amborella trichopoda]
MSFGLTKAPAVFMDLMNRVFRPFLYDFVIVFIDDILVYFKSWELQEQHLRMVFKTLKLERLYAKLCKRECWLPSVAFLEHIISKDGITANPSKIETVLKWERPTNVIEVRSFLELSGYYRRFVEGFSKIVRPLTRLTQKNAKFIWSLECEWSFQEFKKRLVTAPILALQEWNGDFVVYTDASHKGLICVLMQRGRVIAYASMAGKAA